MQQFETGSSLSSITTGTLTVNTTESPRWNFCPECGKKIESDWKHCAGCGRAVGCLTSGYQWYPAMWQYYPAFPVYSPYITYTTQGINTIPCTLTTESR